ncbi:phenazine biosynthesis-like domain-containing protein 1 [Erpetoichthys calabaricus]|uniref:Phenazine biosynthesis like protein domain containing n=1 Tax=Erpetoichthys calabaricus TaxID=27687 RepID=A0A8C4REB4_ERPCA|nr:phenazine biosynthesis-like domain-containing protein 1 [Erpetoichthys calabaricus]
MSLPIFTVDAFTKSAFSGNPAAVCLLESELQDDIYQKIASEMNLSETAFISKCQPQDDFSSGSHFGLRWFTPTNEVALCGHATLASAAVLFFKKKNSNSLLTFETMSGELTARLEGDHIILNFPSYLPTAQNPRDIKQFLETAIGDLDAQEVCYSCETKKLLVRLSDQYDRATLESLSPDPLSLMKSENTGKVKGLIITLKGNPSHPGGHDFYSRYFAPWNGISEDPVTGSAHAVLGSYWSEQLRKKQMLAFQCSKRGGELQLTMRDNGRIDIGGHAVIVQSGTLTI